MQVPIPQGELAQGSNPATGILEISKEDGGEKGGKVREYTWDANFSSPSKSSLAHTVKRHWSAGTIAGSSRAEVN